MVTANPQLFSLSAEQADVTPVPLPIFARRASSGPQMRSFLFRLFGTGGAPYHINIHRSSSVLRPVPPELQSSQVTRNLPTETSSRPSSLPCIFTPTYLPYLLRDLIVALPGLSEHTLRIARNSTTPTRYRCRTRQQTIKLSGLPLPPSAARQKDVWQDRRISQLSGSHLSVPGALCR